VAVEAADNWNKKKKRMSGEDFTSQTSLFLNFKLRKYIIFINYKHNIKISTFTKLM
jgi:hypothetical protein